ncbi:SRPBCC domain-containing protein [Amycolatopsis sp. GM8]|uniref:SRPBCC family protein n=1 Tax=Amycolatopsis sp. GM8 TaxID=2896530 RepID=UPI001F3A0ED0|nr:SRPBCC domain-containing protein [Amycolatopsis sp. GM8]
MTVISSQKNTEALTLTFVAEFDSPVESVWQVWANPRKLERWWGPPTYPATFDEHDLTVSARSRYYMTGPDGGKSHGWWQITAVEPPHRLEFDEGFADEHGEPSTSMPNSHFVVTLEAAGSGTRMTTVANFATADDLEKLVGMGMQEGMRLAMGQIDGVLSSTTV